MHERVKDRREILNMASMPGSQLMVSKDEFNKDELKRTIITLGLPTAHMLTFLSSPPVTITLPDDGPKARQATFEPCATFSSERENREYSNINDSVL